MDVEREGGNSVGGKATGLGIDQEELWLLHPWRPQNEGGQGLELAGMERALLGCFSHHNTRMFLPSCFLQAF